MESNILHSVRGKESASVQEEAEAEDFIRTMSAK
jgi:hypothetical protein